MHYVKLAGLIVTCWVALAWVLSGGRRGERDIAVIAVAAILAHVPMLFIFATHYRYAMLAWDLSLVVLVVWTLRLATAPAYRSATAAPGAALDVLQPR